MRKTIIIMLTFSLFLSSGCHTLRKKFIRKKKYRKETPVYVDFKDYPEVPPPSAYRDYFLFVKGWLEELKSALERGMSWKRQKRAIDEAIMNVEQMFVFFNEEGKEQLNSFYLDFVSLKEDVYVNPTMNDLKRLRAIKTTESLKRRFEREFKFSNAEQWMVQR